MIRLTSNSLIIEIPTGNETPLEKLAQMQKGLLNIPGLIDYTENPPAEVHEALWTLKNLLQQMLLSPDQLCKVNEVAAISQELKEAFC